MTEQFSQYQIIEQLKKGADSWNAWRQSIAARNRSEVKLDLSGVDLRDFNFSYYKLHFVNFSNAVLEDCNFIDADIYQAIFADAELGKADLRVSSGEGADFRGASLENADFSGSNFSNAVFQGVNAYSTNFRNAQLVNADFYHSTLTLCTFDGAVLKKANFCKALLDNAFCESANFQAAQMREAVLTKAHLRHAYMPKAILEGADLTKADLTEADLEGANLQHANLIEAILESTILGGADLTYAKVKAEQLTDAYMPETIMGDDLREQLDALMSFNDVLENKPKEDSAEPPLNETAQQTNIRSIYADLSTNMKASSNRQTIDAEPLHSGTEEKKPSAVDKKAVKNTIEVIDGIQARTGVGTVEAVVRNPEPKRQFLSAFTPISFQRSDGSTETLTIESIAIPFWNQRNSLSKLFETTSASLILEEDIRSLEAGEDWLDVLIGNRFSEDDQEKCFNAISTAMEQQFAVPYYNCLDWLTLEKLNVIKTGLLFCKEFGNGNAIVGAFQIGACVVILSISYKFAKEMYSPSENTQAITKAFANRIVSMIEEKDKELEDN